MQTLTVIVHGKGRPPAVASYPSPDEAGRARPPLTVTLADKVGSAAVTVVKDGKPLPGAGVRISLLGAVSLYDRHYVGSAREPGRDKLDALFHPTAVTGPDGIARFGELFPGVYHVIAVESDNPQALHTTRWARDKETAFGEDIGLPVIAGRETRASLAVHRQACEVRFQVLRPNGEPVRDQGISFSFGLGDTNTSTSLDLSGEGFGTFAFEAPGLWSIDARFRDTATESYPIHQEPFYQAEALVPVSPGLNLGGPIKLRGVRRDRGSLRVRLTGANGLPARGVVAHVGFNDRLDHAGTVDDQGEVRFADLRAGRYELLGFIEGLAPPPVVEPSGPLPDEPLLRSARVVRPESAEVKPGVETRAELRTEPVGFLRGRLLPPAGCEASDFSATVLLNRRDLEIRWRMDPKTGRYSFGPLPAGPLTLRFHQVKGKLLLEAGTQDVEVIPGAAAEVDLKPRAAQTPQDGDGRQAFLGMGGVSEIESAPNRVQGTVLLADGTTPAFAAQALLFVPGEAQAVGEGVTDAAGRLTCRGRWVTMDPDARVPEGLAKKPTVVVRLPGETGATILNHEAGKPIRAVLPVPISTRGLVTLGGRPIGGRNARVRVVAAYQGRGVLGDALGVEASAQADGRFVLAGLTPGRYLVQAARDGIWLSSSFELVVEESKAPPVFVLDVPEPGAPAALEVVDPDGRPVAGEVVRAVRPEGPLRSLWAAGLRTDADGLVTVWGLEAGPHEVRIGDQHMRHEVRISEARGAATRPDATRVILRRTDPARPGN
jgi:hypothetical protein